jgi:hypothetical protein
MATNLYKEAIHVPFMSKFVVFSKRHEQLEVKLKTTISNYFFSNFLPANACSKKHVPSFLLVVVFSMFQLGDIRLLRKVIS